MFLTWFNYDSIWYFNNGPRAQSSFRSLRFQAGWSPKPSTFGEGVAGLEGLEGLEGLAAEAMRREHMLAPPVDSACFSGSVTTRDSQVTFQWDVNSLKNPKHIQKAARSAVADLQVVLLGRSPGDHCRVGSSAVGALSALGKVQEDQWRSVSDAFGDEFLSHS